MKTQSNTFQASGQAAAADQNRQHQARLEILQALQRIGIPCPQWPKLVRAFYSSSPQRIAFRQRIWTAPFQPPPFDSSMSLRKSGKQKADAEWEQYCEPFLERCEFWVQQRVDEKIAGAKRRRGTGKAQSPRKRKNTPVERRYEWAARRLCGEAWKEIAARYECQESTVTKAATEVLRVAHWPTKPKSQR